MKKLKKMSLLLFLALSIFAASTTAQAKASSKTKTAVNKVVKDYFNAQKKFNPSKMNKCLVKAFWGPNDNSIYLTQYWKKYNKKLTYKISSTSVKGKNATVKVKCTFYSAYNAWKACIWDLSAQYLRENTDPDTATVGKGMDAWMKKNNSGYPPKKRTVTLKLNLTKKNGKWKIKTVTEAMQNVYLLDFDRAMDYFASLA